MEIDVCHEKLKTDPMSFCCKIFCISAWSTALQLMVNDINAGLSPG